MVPPRLLPFLACAALSTPVPTAAAQDRPPTFADPHPPKVHELAEVQSPAPKAFPELRFHAAPRPLAKGAVTQSWPSFLGPARDGRSKESPLLVDWPDGGPTLVWEMQRGAGYACPVVEGSRLVYTHRVENETVIDCLDAETGRRFWQLRYPCDYGGRFFSDGGPRSTPVISEGRVYVHGVGGVLHCLDLATGRIIWRRDLAAEFSIPDEFFGVVSSPLVVADLLIQSLGVPGGPTVAAFDKRTGRLVWGAGTEWGASCASPVAAEVHGREHVFVIAGGDSRPPTGGLLVIDAATGALESTYSYWSRTYTSVSASSPVVTGDLVFLTASYNTGSAGLRLAPDGELEETWTTRRFGLQFSNLIHIGGHLYGIDGVSDRMGALLCVDAATGVERSRTDLDWEETVLLRGEEQVLSFSVGEGSLLHADGRFLCLGDNGHLLWIAASPAGATVLARATLFHANKSWSPPVISRGLLYVCQNTRERFGARSAPRLLCFDLRGER